MVPPSRSTTPEAVVTKLVRFIDGITPDHYGRFFTWKGREQVW